tara:strand:- start:1802 stop:1993 length:192 start_codon:yes stop_codon:yes gene_type:complete
MHNPFENNLIIIEEIRESWSCVSCVDDANVAIMDTLLGVLVKINNKYSEAFVEDQINKIIEDE